jgi:pyruvate/2-oxoacid:ferredoxin oxidoreductase beta subunit
MADKLLGGMVQSAADRAQPLLRAGNTNCGGCGMSLALHMLGRAAGDRPLQLVIPACCAMVAAGPFPLSGITAPVVSSTMAATAALGAGLSRVARLNGEATRIVCFAGDGATFDIGFASLSAAAERNEHLLYVCYDNEIYGNTGGQRSSATPSGAVTTTSPEGKESSKKDIVAILAAHHVPYLATVSLAHADDALRKLRLALDAEGFRFLHVLSPCPTGWKSEPSDGIELVRQAVRSGLFPVLEVLDGDRWVINVEPELGSDALARYLGAQGRFRRTEAVERALRGEIDRTWTELRRRAAFSASPR